MRNLIILILICYSSFQLNAQFAIQLWNEDLDLNMAKEAPWNEREICTIEDSTAPDCVRTIFTEEGEIHFLHKDEAGAEFVYARTFYPNELTEVCEMEGGDTEVKKFNEAGLLIEQIWQYPGGSRDLNTFEYEDGRLVKITEEDEFGLVWEKLTYEDDRLVLIENFEDDDLVMQRKFIHDTKGNLVEQHRIEEDEINKKTFYQYNAQNQLIQKETKAINRLSGNIMRPDVWTFSYYDNGALKKEIWTTYIDQSKTDKKEAYIEEYLPNGLLSKEIDKDFIEKTEDVTTYVYKLKE